MRTMRPVKNVAYREPINQLLIHKMTLTIKDLVEFKTAQFMYEIFIFFFFKSEWNGKWNNCVDFPGDCSFTHDSRTFPPSKIGAVQWKPTLVFNCNVNTVSYDTRGGTKYQYPSLTVQSLQKSAILECGHFAKPHIHFFVWAAAIFDGIWDSPGLLIPICSRSASLT